MSFEYDDKGKIYTEVITKTAISALVQTTTHLIQGKVHVRRDDRLIDELDRDKPFLAITEASIIGSGGETLREVPFIAVSRSQIVWISPDEALEQTGSES